VIDPSAREPERTIEEEIGQHRPFHSVHAAAAVSIMRTAALIDRYYSQILAREDLTPQQYNVLRILRGAGSEGMPTLEIRNRMIHEAPGITRLIDRLEESGLVRRERTRSDRRQVLCYISDRGLEVLTNLDTAMKAADLVAVAGLTEPELRELLHLLSRIRAAHRACERKVVLEH
jgi:DNA-binding MarR family transcriptional regulator